MTSSPDNGTAGDEALERVRRAARRYDEVTGHYFHQAAVDEFSMSPTAIDLRSPRRALFDSNQLDLRTASAGKGFVDVFEPAIVGFNPPLPLYPTVLNEVLRPGVGSLNLVYEVGRMLEGAQVSRAHCALAALGILRRHAIQRLEYIPRLAPTVPDGGYFNPWEAMLLGTNAPSTGHALGLIEYAACALVVGDALDGLAREVGRTARASQRDIRFSIEAPLAVSTRLIREGSFEDARVSGPARREAVWTLRDKAIAAAVRGQVVKAFDAIFAIEKIDETALENSTPTKLESWAREAHSEAASVLAHAEIDRALVLDAAGSIGNR